MQRSKLPTQRQNLQPERSGPSASPLFPSRIYRKSRLAPIMKNFGKNTSLCSDAEETLQQCHHLSPPHYFQQTCFVPEPVANPNQNAYLPWHYARVCGKPSTYLCVRIAFRLAQLCWILLDFFFCTVGSAVFGRRYVAFIQPWAARQIAKACYVAIIFDLSLLPFPWPLAFRS